jgi:hypothetical protein
LSRLLINWETKRNYQKLLHHLLSGWVARYGESSNDSAVVVFDTQIVQTIYAFDGEFLIGEELLLR